MYMIFIVQCMLQFLLMLVLTTFSIKVYM